MGQKKSGERSKEKKKSEPDNQNNGRKMVTDPRFKSVHFDPRFQRPPKHQSKVKIDSRFERLFTDKKFATSSAPTDKRGKLKNQDSVNPLRHYYNIDEEEDKKKKESENTDKTTKEVEIESESEEEEEDIVNEDLKKKLALNADLSSSESEGAELSDELQSESDNDSTSDSDTDDENVAYSDEEPEEEKEKIPEIDKETHRLAVVNMDWSHVRAADLYVIMSSFVPQGGRILSVSVYPSEFGLKRMEEEAVKGPVGLFDSDKEKSDDEDEDDDEIDVEKLRAYEKSRLRYYFAVVECDSINTADHIYKNCDGMEFEKSSNMLDLRFIPDTMQFEHPPRDVAKEAPSKYEGLDFHTHALQQSKIHLTWDEDEPQRTKTLRRKLNDDQLAELELKEFLASDDGDSDDENDGAADGESSKEPSKVDKYRSLIQAGDGSDEDDDNDMEVTFNTGLEDISKRILEKKKDKKSETVWEAHLRKQKEKKKARRNRSKDSSEADSSYSDLEVPEQPDDFFLEEPSTKNSKMGKGSHREKQEEDTDKEQEASRAELELLLADDQEADRSLKGYNLKPKKAKGKKGKEIPAVDKLPSVDLNDPRFSALINNPLFALDPTDAQYKRSAAYARQIAERKQKGVGEESEKGQHKPSSNAPLPSDDTQSKRSEQLLSDSQSSKMENPELSTMIRSMKRKAQQYQATPSGNMSRKIVPKHSSGLLPKLSSMFLSGKKKARHSKS